VYFVSGYRGGTVQPMLGAQGELSVDSQPTIYDVADARAFLFAPSVELSTHFLGSSATRDKVWPNA